MNIYLMLVSVRMMRATFNVSSGKRIQKYQSGIEVEKAEYGATVSR
jgi:hypothetical protein